MKKNQYGRSMVEMLGVLAIIGVISVGGYSIVGKAVSQRKSAQIIVDAATLAESAKKLACQYDSDYSSYSSYLYYSEAYPKELSYSGSNGFVGTDDVTYKLQYSKSTTTTGHDYLRLSIGNVAQDECIRIASSDWGTTKSSGFVGLSIGTSNEKNCIIKNTSSCATKTNIAVAGRANYPMSKGNAAANCTSELSNTVQLWYKGCL